MVDAARLWQVPVTYGAVGGTRAADLLEYPPEGYRPLERSARIGHGVDRWRTAGVEALSWGIKLRSGFRVTPLPAPDSVVDNTYSPVSFDDDGVPVAPATTAIETQHAPDGRALVRAGDSALLRIGWGWLSVSEPVRVVYLVDEPTRRGFAYGTLPGHPLKGEELFVVEHRDDDSVWLTIRAFSKPSNGLWWLLSPALRALQRMFLARYLRALAGSLA